MRITNAPPTLGMKFPNEKNSNKLMHVFYTPDIQTRAELPEEEAQHCVRVLRLNIGDQITLTDGKGNFYRAE